MITPVPNLSIAPSSGATSGGGGNSLTFGNYGAGVSTPSLTVIAVGALVALFILKGRK